MSARGIMVLSLVLSMTAAGAARAEQISSTTPVNAFLNLGATPYPEPGAAQITTGDAQPWYDSSELSRFFGGQPTVQQQQSFDNAIVQDVQQAFSLSGVPITVTDNPYVPASHTLSLVSNTASMAFPGAIGTSQIGGNGFSFINAIAPYAQSLTQLEWIIAHNMSHEADAHLRGRGELRHHRELHRRTDGELVDDHQPDLDVQPGRRRRPPVGDDPDQHRLRHLRPVDQPGEHQQRPRAHDLGPLGPGHGDPPLESAAQGPRLGLNPSPRHHPGGTTRSRSPHPFEQASDFTG